MHWGAVTSIIFALLFSTLLGTSVHAYEEDPALKEARLSKLLSANNLKAADRARLLMDRGLARDAQKRPQAALDDFTLALSLHALPATDIARLRFNRAVMLDQLMRSDEALIEYDAALRLERRFAAAYNNRANLYRRLGRLEPARLDYLASIQSGNPQTEYPLYGLGQIAEAMSRRDEARDYYERALRANADYAPAAQRLAVLNAPDAPPDKQQQASIALALPAPTVAPVPPGLPRQRAAYTLIPPKADPDIKILKPTARLIQLGSFRKDSNAMVEWGRVKNLLGDALQGVNPNVVPVDLPQRGRFYRLRAGPVDDAAAICDRLTQAGYYCLLL